MVGLALIPVFVETFGGLRLDLDPEEGGLNSAIDVLNCDFDRRGRVRSRDGFTKYTSSAADDPYTQLGTYTPIGDTTTVIAGRGANVDALDTDGSVLATAGGGSSDTVWSFVPFGTPTVQYTYVNGWDPSGTAYLKNRWTGSAFGSTSIPDGRHVVVSPTDNRLAVASLDGDLSRIEFSDPGDPETWSASNHVDLYPGDGENITCAITWRDLIFVFKETKFFVFYGNSTDASGDPIFNYRTVNTGVSALSPTGACIAPEGVYFVHNTGVYRTSGGPPELVSSAITPLFVGNATTYFQGESPDATKATLAYSNRRLYMGSGAGNGMLVYDVDMNAWMYWGISVNGLTAGPTGALWFSYDGTNDPTATNDVGLFSNSATDDAGTDIASRYRSGFGDFGHAGREKTVRETELVGQGTVEFGWSRDFGAITTSSTADVTLGTAPTPGRQLHRSSQDGELLSWQASSVSGGAWVLNRLVPMLRDVRGPAEFSS